MSHDPSLSVSEASENPSITPPAAKSASVLPGAPLPPDAAWLEVSRVTPAADGDLVEAVGVPADPVLHAMQVRARPVENWADPPDAGGADDYADAPVEAFCTITGKEPGVLPKKKRRSWGRALRAVAEEWGIGPSELATCILTMPNSGIAWKVKGYGDPNADGFRADLGGIIHSALSGNMLATGQQIVRVGR